MPRKVKTDELSTNTVIEESVSIANAADMEKTEENAVTASQVIPEVSASAISTAPIKSASASILTLNADTEIETPESREETIWHELQNAYRTKKILTGNLGGIEKMEGGRTIAVIYYKEMRIAIPLK